MDLLSIGRLIYQQRAAQGLRLIDLAEEAGVGRSTLAALESGKLPELGFNKVARICAAAGIILETHPPLPHYPPRSLTDATGRELTKQVIEGIILGGDGGAWHTLIRALKRDNQGLLAFRIRKVVGALDRNDPSVAAFTALLPGNMQRAIARAADLLRERPIVLSKG